MLPRNVRSTYQQYRKDTHDVASWLKTTANKLGFVPGTGGASSASSPNPPLQSTNNTTTTIVPTQEYVAMADFIKAQETPIPATFTFILDRAIAIREHYSSVLSSLQSDNRQAILLNALKRVRSILAPHHDDGSAARMRSPRSLRELHDMFSNVDLNPISIAPRGDLRSLVRPSSPTQGDAERFEAEIPDGMEEDFLALQLLLADLTKLRIQVSHTWSIYKEGLIDIITASLVTDFAVVLSRSLENSCKAQFVKHRGVLEMLNFIFRHQCLIQGIDPQYRELPDDELNYRMYDYADAVFLIPFYLLTKFVGLTRPGMVGMFKDGAIGDYDPTSDRTRMESRGKYREDQRVLFKMLPEFHAMASCADPAPAEDELSLSLRELFDTGTPTLSIAFATQLYLDINAQLRDQMERPFFQLSTLAACVRKNIKEALEFHKDLGSSDWSKEHDKKMTELSKNIFTYILLDIHRTVCRGMGRIKLPKPYHFLRHHPWACGLWKYYIQVQLHSLGIELANAWGSIMSSAHLYSVLLEEGIFLREWPDMRILFALRDAKDFSVSFFGGAPRMPKHFLEQFTLATGISAASFAPRQQQAAQPTTPTFRKLKRARVVFSEMAPIMRVFKDKYVTLNEQFELRAQDVRRVLELYNLRAEVDPPQYLSPLQLRDSGPIAVPGFQKMFARRVSADQFLAILSMGIQAEVLELAFDYLTHHRTCWHLLSFVKYKCHDQLVAKFGPNYIEHEKQLPLIVGYLFATYKREGTNTLMDDATAVMLEMLAVDMGDVVQKLLGEKLGTPVVLL